jgi:hypothetical protein
MIDAMVTRGAQGNADELVVRARTDRQAFSELYEHYYEPIRLYCVRRLFIVEIAEDVASDVFLTVAKQIHTFKGSTDQAFRSWIYTMNSNSLGPRYVYCQKTLNHFQRALRALRLSFGRPKTSLRYPSTQSSPSFVLS